MRMGACTRRIILTNTNTRVNCQVQQPSGLPMVELNMLK
jgi:hypothetical protein